jgi:hypothetical protein
MVSRSTLRATLFALLVSMLVVMGPGLFARAIEGGTPNQLLQVPRLRDLILENALTPPLTLMTLTFHGGVVRGDSYALLRITAALLGLLVFMFLTAAMWASMLTRLRSSASEVRE